MANQRYVDYIRTNKDKYTIDSLKENLLKSGVPSSEVEEAVRLAVDPGQAVPPVPVEPGAVAMSPPGIQQEGPAPSQNLPFSIQNIIMQAKQVLLDPFAFFRAMPKKGGFKDPFLFLFAMAISQVLISMVLKFGLGALGLGGRSFLGSTMGITMMIGGLVLGLIMLPIIALVIAGIAHVIWMLLGSKAEFETSFRCVAYASAIAPVHAVANSVPSIGVWLAIPVAIYGLYLYIPASVEVHGIKRKTVTIIFAVLSCLALLSLIGSAVAVWKLKQLAKSAAESPLAENLRKFKELAEAMEKTSRPPAALADSSAGMQSPTSASQASQEEQAMQMATAVFKTMAGAKNTELVDDKLLKELLPEKLYGMERTRATSTTQEGFGIKVAMARATYTTASGKTITIKISDTGGLGGIYSMGWDAASQDQMASRGIKHSEYKGFKARERYNSQSKRGKFTVLVGKRFILDITGGFSVKNLRSVADNIDLNELRSLSP